jgi:hypothetical protein
VSCIDYISIPSRCGWIYSERSPLAWWAIIHSSKGYIRTSSSKRTPCLLAIQQHTHRRLFVLILRKRTVYLFLSYGAAQESLLRESHSCLDYPHRVRHPCPVKVTSAYSVEVVLQRSLQIIRNRVLSVKYGAAQYFYRSSFIRRCQCRAAHLVAAARARRVRESDRERTDAGPAAATNKKNVITHKLKNQIKFRLHH